MAIWAGFRSGESVIYAKGGKRYLATVAEGKVGKVDPGCVPIVLVAEGKLMYVPADSLTGTRQ